MTSDHRFLTVTFLSFSYSLLVKFFVFYSSRQDINILWLLNFVFAMCFMSVFDRCVFITFLVMLCFLDFHISSFFNTCGYDPVDRHFYFSPFSSQFRLFASLSSSSLYFFHHNILDVSKSSSLASPSYCPSFDLLPLVAHMNGKKTCFT